MAFQLVKLIDPINNVVITGGVVPKGEYNNSTDYAVGDWVSYKGSSYVLYSDVSAGTLPTNTTYWMMVASAAVITVSATAPANPEVNDLWYDIS